MQKDYNRRIWVSGSALLVVQRDAIHLHESTVAVCQLLRRDSVCQGCRWPFQQRLHKLLESWHGVSAELQQRQQDILQPELPL